MCSLFKAGDFCSRSCSVAIGGGVFKDCWSFHTPIPAKMFQFDEHMFQMGGFNHHLGRNCGNLPSGTGCLITMTSGFPPHKFLKIWWVGYDFRSVLFWLLVNPRRSAPAYPVSIWYTVADDIDRLYTWFTECLLTALRPCWGRTMVDNSILVSLFLEKNYGETHKHWIWFYQEVYMGLISKGTIPRVPSFS